MYQRVSAKLTLDCPATGTLMSGSLLVYPIAIDHFTIFKREKGVGHVPVELFLVV